MDPKTVSALHDFTLEARHFLEEQASEQLEGLYGWLPAGEIKPAKDYPALESHAEAKETRRRFEQYLADETAAGLKAEQARQKLVKEAAFTCLNRFVAFKLMEGNGLIKQTVSKGADSNAFKLWLTERGNEQWLEDYKRGDLPKDEIDEGPRERAYRRFLLAQCAKLAEEIRILFDPDDLPSSLFPRPSTRQRLIDLLNEEDLAEAWQPGNEESIGWIYQYFNEPDVAVFRGRSAPKVPAHLLPARTQQYTPRWVVKFLLHNSLGALWLRMHPDSQLSSRLDYLVPRPGTPPSQVRRAAEITVLDPACGTMHFGLVAFDLLSEMYREEIQRAGEPGWPKNPSVTNETEIPAAVMANNLFGIDIDLRAVQLSALALYVRAKRVSPQVRIATANLVCADISLLDGSRLSEFIREMEFTEPVYERLLRAIWPDLRNVNQFGSLLRIEKEIRRLVDLERKALAGGLPLFEQVWDRLDAQIFQALDEFARRQETRGDTAAFFTGEAVKGFELLELLVRRYDVVVANPPYLDGRDCNPVLKEFLDAQYPQTKRNLYSAFIERCLELLSSDGALGIITGQSFMFISSFEDFRKECLSSNVVDCLAQFDYGLFAARVDTAAYILRRESDGARRRESVGTYFRLVKEPDTDAKRQAFEAALTKLKVGEQDSHVFQYRQGNFDDIPGSPWVYWITRGLRELFKTLPKLGEVARPRQGLATADNFRFLRYWWEIGKSPIGFGCRSQEECERRSEEWYPYMKGGSFARWHGNQEYVINYGRSGFELKSWAAPLYGNSGWSRIIKSPDFYFRRGVTYSYLTAGRFSARLSPGGFIFDVAGSSLFPDNVPLVLAVMNSEFAAYALKLINPTVNFQVGDLRRLPIAKQSSEVLEKLVEEAVSLAKADSEEDETTYDFTAPPAWATGLQDVIARHERMAAIERVLNNEVYRLYGISDEDRTAIEAELGEGTSSGNGDNGDEEEQNGEDSEAEAVAEAPLTREELAQRWISYAVGTVLGRFEVSKQNALGRGRFGPEACEQLRPLVAPRGILVQDEGHPDDLTHRVLEALHFMLGTKQAGEVVHAATSEPGPAEEILRDYLKRDFFKWHVKEEMYRKRPVYWPLESPRRLYGVWLFHERLANDTLLRIQTDYVRPKIRGLDSELKEVQSKLGSASGIAKRELKKREGDVIEALDDVREFQERIERVIHRGYTPHIDDGVLLNMAPLWELTPSWQAEPKKAWKALAEEKYDWSHQAMDHWPDRVKEKCKTNKSFAIAHGLEKLEAAGG